MSAKKDFIPAYYKLAEDIKKQIESGQLRPGDVVPSETQLVNYYGISRATVRQGLALLLEDGLIEKVRGKGTFVAKPRLDQVTLIFRENNIVEEEVRFKLLEVKQLKAVGQIAAKLNVSEGTEVFLVRRLLTGKNGPLGIDVKYLPYLDGKLVLDIEQECVDFPEIIARHTGDMIHKIERSISATSLTPQEAEILKTVKGQPALCITQIIYAKNEKILGISKTIYPRERFELKTVSYPYAGKMS